MSCSRIHVMQIFNLWRASIFRVVSHSRIGNQIFLSILIFRIVVSVNKLLIEVLKWWKHPGIELYIPEVLLLSGFRPIRNGGEKVPVEDGFVQLIGRVRKCLVEPMKELFCSLLLTEFLICGRGEVVLTLGRVALVWRNKGGDVRIP